jgi:hypothetical protein
MVYWSGQSHSVIDPRKKSFFLLAKVLGCLLPKKLLMYLENPFRKSKLRFHSELEPLTGRRSEEGLIPSTGEPEPEGAGRMYESTEVAPPDAEAARLSASNTAQKEIDESDPRARIDRFIDGVLRETGRPITRTDIWRTAGYKEATEFERFQRGRGSAGSAAKFNRILNLKPNEFLERLDKVRLLEKARTEEQKRTQG